LTPASCQALVPTMALFSILTLCKSIWFTQSTPLHLCKLRKQTHARCMSQKNDVKIWQTKLKRLGNVEHLSIYYQ
jgi:hypothetical protein